MTCGTYIGTWRAALQRRARKASSERRKHGPESRVVRLVLLGERGRWRTCDEEVQNAFGDVSVCFAFGTFFLPLKDHLSIPWCSCALFRAACFSIVLFTLLYSSFSAVCRMFVRRLLVEF